MRGIGYREQTKSAYPAGSTIETCKSYIVVSQHIAVHIKKEILMIFNSLRKRALIVAFGLLALPSAALADGANDHSNHRFFMPENAQSSEGFASYQMIEGAAPVSLDECRLLEMNIPGYNCEVALADFASFSDPYEVPEGVDYLFWEQNVWMFDDGFADFQGDPDAGMDPSMPSDVPQLPVGYTAY